MATRERVNEILDELTADTELTPEMMDKLTAYREELISDGGGQIDQTEYDSVVQERDRLREENGGLKEENGGLKEEMRKRFFEKMEDALDEEEEEEEKEPTFME